MVDALDIVQKDPLVDVEDEDNSGKSSSLGDYIHVRVQKRNGRKSVTTVQGLDTKYDYKKILKALKKEFCCNGTVAEHPELGKVLQLQGDQRKPVSQFLVESSLAKREKIKLHGF